MLRDPSLLVASSGSRDAGGRPLPPGRTVCPAREPRDPPLSCQARDALSFPPRGRCECSQCQCARRFCSPVSWQEVFSFFSGSLERGSTSPLTFKVLSLLKGVKGSTFSRCQTRDQDSACEISKRRAFPGICSSVGWG